MVKKEAKKEESVILHLSTSFMKKGRVHVGHACDPDNDISDDKVAKSLDQVSCLKCQKLIDKE